MKINYSKLAIVLFLSANAYADQAISTNTSGLSLSLTGLYLQPNADNLTYAVYTTPLPITTPNWTQVTLKPGYSAAFDLGLQYAFADTFNNANLDWLHLSTNNSNSYYAGGVNTSVAPPYYFGPLAQALTGTAADSQVKFNVDNINLTLDHVINLTPHINLDPFAGIQTAYLKQYITSNYVGRDSNSFPYSIYTYNTSKFTGIGPRLGVNAIYFLTDHFNVSIKMGGSLLMGRMQSNTNFNSYGAGNTTLAYTTLADQSINKIVPEVDGKLEGSYLFPMKTSGSSLTLAAGYMFTDYFNGLNQVVPTALVPGAFNGGTIAIETSAQTQSNLSLNGPYLSLVWKC